MRASTKRFASLLVSLLFAGSAIIVYASFLSPVFQEVAALRGKILAQSELLANENAAIGKFKNLLSVYSDQYQALDKTLSATLPTKEEVPSAVNQIQVLSRVSNLALQSVTFKYAALKPSAKAQVASLVKPLGTLTITLQTAGSYENLKSFLHALETNIRVMDISSLKLSPVRKGEAVVPDLFLYTVEVTTYYQ